MKKSLVLLLGAVAILTSMPANAVISKYGLSEEIFYGLDAEQIKNVHSKIDDSEVVFDKNESNLYPGFNAIRDSWFYVFIGGGAIIPMDFKINDATDSEIAKLEYQNVGWNAMGGIGANLFSFMRTDVEMGIHNLSFENNSTSIVLSSDSLKVRNLTAMGNIYFDLFGRYYTTGDSVWKNGFTPYVGAGCGLSYIDLPDMKISGVPVINDADYQFAWQAMAGFSFSITDTFNVDIGYKYINFGKYDNDIISGKLVANEINLKLISSF